VASEHTNRKFPDGTNRERESKGCPIGNLTSQLFANIYLNELDQFVKDRLRISYYIRYTDDFVIVHHDKNYLLNLKTQIEKFLNDKLKLDLHPHKVTIRRYEQGIDFLGYIAFPNHLILRNKTKRRIFRKIKMLVRLFKNEEISEISFTQSLNSYFGVLGHANTQKLKQSILHRLWLSLKSPD
jgi:hypothetical protein